ncbi:allophanate hydrolase subunit 1 [Christiangramia fulva]|uniref:Allophanate hydrolase subunit 1 n=1 Tax=Christiangramia fulva TaxID=2126553 RepID=A0A2R3Z9K8_9FLAO|nr:5-oxoprolinase subunit PxpB [Christiangramia fulva]AVR46975.1 allophanate hydrolase subunit 1 [Christiangramia fulva]
MPVYPQIVPMGEQAILINFKPEISSEQLEKVLFYKRLIKNSEFKVKVEVLNTYNSLLINYDSTIEDAYSEFSRLKSLLKTAKIEKKGNSRLFYVPVCYDEEFGFDLQLISEQKNISISEIIELHTRPVYLIYFLGFLPGFLYLGGLDEKLHFPRKNSPRKQVEKGSVGIGGNQTGIYPENSPGGWQILGRTPVKLFNPKLQNPSPFSAGDHLKFYAVSRDEYLALEEEINAGQFQFKSENYES